MKEVGGERGRKNDMQCRYGRGGKRELKTQGGEWEGKRYE
jgi:hypothetical protein